MPAERTETLSTLSEDFNRDLCEENVNNSQDASASLLASLMYKRETQKGLGVKTSGAANAGAPIQAAIL